MAKSKYEIEVLGDSSKFNKTVSDSIGKIDELSAHAGGFFDGVSSKAQNATGALNALSKMGPGMMALGGAAAGAAVAFTALNNAADVASSLSKVSIATGVSVEKLQQLKTTFRDTGMEIEKFGDLNKDVLDHLGDAYRDGSGPADDMKALGLNLKEYTKYINQADGGINALIHTFYELRKAGKSTAEITNLMETLGSDGSHLVSVLNRFGSEQDAVNAITSTSVGLTNEGADAYRIYQSRVEELTNRLNLMVAEGLSPVVEHLNNIGNWMDSPPKGTGVFDELNEKIKESKGTLQDILDIYKELKLTANLNLYGGALQTGALASNKEKEASSNKELLDIPMLTPDLMSKALNRLNKETNGKGWTKPDDGKSKAAKEKAELAKLISERKSALEQLNQLNNMLYSGSANQISQMTTQNQAAIASLKKLYEDGYITQEQYVAKRDALLAKDRENIASQLLGADPKTLAETTRGIKQVYEQQNADLKTKLDKQLIDQKTYNAQLEALQTEHEGRLAAIKNMNGDLANSRMAVDMGMGTVQDEMAIEQAKLDQQATEWLDAQKSMYELGTIDHDEFLARKARLDELYSAKSKNISMMEIKSKMNMYAGFASGMTGIISGIAGENSKAARASFAVSKGLAVAQATVNAYQSATASMALYPGPLGYAMAASSYAQAIGQVMQMKSVQGQFHDGIDNVPNTGTYLLESGERVVDKRLNQDLKDFIGGNGNASNQAPMNVDASISNIKTTVDQRQLMAILKKQQQDITQIVNDGNRRRM
ncbi:hypothetical protein D5R38_18595 [Serratia marcescens]|uniref:SHOCT domain-containing protein n=1 Tax=Serratia marcescens TaxID=615 RepID=UPI00106844AE|nr:SHOCT domain-containing protein [Serratia marcescens]TEW83380.1 hypothetical protein D5R38_18595 [Serratia marcescens]